MLKRLFGRRRNDPPVGGLYASPTEDGAYSILKVLAVDDAAVHVRMYSNRYAAIPTEPPNDLEMIGMGPDFVARIERGEKVEPPGRLGIGHLPISRSTFERTERHLIGVVQVDPSELEGYEMWREGGGGVWA